MISMSTRPNYYLFTGAILVYAIGLGMAKAFGAAALCVLAAAVIHLGARHAPAGRVGCLEGWAYLVIMSLFFFSTTRTIPMIRPEVKYDAWLQLLDRRWFPPLEEWIPLFTAPLLTDILTVCYLIYGPMMYSSIIYFAFFKKELGLPYFAGLFSIFGLGFLGYLAIPAEGPHFARFQEVMPLIASGPFHTFADPLIKGGCTHSDAFPSLHIAITVFTLIFMFRNSRQLFRLWILPSLGLCLATVYLFYHYQIDVLAGLLLALCAAFLARRAQRKLTGKSHREVV